MLRRYYFCDFANYHLISSKKKKKATVEFKHNVTCDDAQGKIEIFLKRRYNLSSS